MDSKIKDTVFSILMFLLGGYVVIEGVRMFRKAAMPPYRIQNFSISPAMLPVVLGCVLIALSIILFVKSFAGEKGFGKIFIARMVTFKDAFFVAIKTEGVRKMIIGVIMMAVLIFGFMGRIPFVIGGIIFMFALMMYLRASKWWICLLCSIGSMALIYLLFSVIFRIPLP